MASFKNKAPDAGQPDGQPRDDDRQYDQRCQEDIRAGQEGGRAVTVRDGRRIPKHPCADLRSDDAR